MNRVWNSLRISIAGAKLSHLVQKDKIWDHGSMAEQARIIFYLLHKAKANGNVDALKRHCSFSGFMKLKSRLVREQEKGLVMSSPVIEELAIVGVHPGKSKRPDKFSALIKGYNERIENGKGLTSENMEFVGKWFFVRQGDWWVLDDMQSK